MLQCQQFGKEPHMEMKVMCPHTIGHIVYLEILVKSDGKRDWEIDSSVTVTVTSVWW